MVKVTVELEVDLVVLNEFLGNVSKAPLGPSLEEFLVPYRWEYSEGYGLEKENTGVKLNQIVRVEGDES